MANWLKLPSSVYYFPRRTHVFVTAAVVYLILKSTQLLNKLLRRTEQQIEAAWSRANHRSATVILATATARRGLWIKCCQYMAARSDALPEEYATVLSKSLDDCPPTPAPSILRLVNEELAQCDAGVHFTKRHTRVPTVDDFFSDFDATAPIASASIAQVHVATERATGRRVVLKIQHPNVRPMLLQDLEDLITLLRLVAGAEPKYDFRPVLNAWIDMVPLETNFTHERQNLDEIRTALANIPPPLRTTAYVPTALPQYSGDKLLVMEYIDGCKISDVADMPANGPVNRIRLVEEITNSFGGQLFFCNVFSGDPHPGNFLVHRLEDGGQPVLLDFGICVTVSDDLRRGFASLILAVIHSDSYALLQSLRDIGVKLNRADPVASLDVVKYMFRTTAPREQSRKEQTDMRNDLEQRVDEIEKNERENPLADADKLTNEKGEAVEPRSPLNAFPGHLTFFFRSLGMLRGLAVSLNVRHSYLDALRPFAEHVLLNTCPEALRVSHPVHRPFVAHGERAMHAASLLQHAFEKLYAADKMIGMQVAVYKDDALVLSMAAGRKGRNNARAVHEDTLFNSFSTTKGLTAILFASLQDEYGVEYSDLVTKYWPEFAQGGKGNTTIAHILSHTSGLALTLPEDFAMQRLRDDWEGIIRHFEQASASQPPGTKMEYHALSFGWLVAGLIQKITGKSYQHHLHTLVRKLGIEDECFCGNMPSDLLADTSESRVASLSSSIFQDLQQLSQVQKLLRKRSKHSTGTGDRDEGTDDTTKSGVESDSFTHRSFEDATAKMGNLQEQTDKAMKDLDLPMFGGKMPAYMLDLNFYNHPILRAGFVPSANGHFTARALARLYATLANEGAVDEARILSAERVEKLRAKIVGFEYREQRAWAAGLTLFNTVDMEGNVRTEDAIGHGGIGGSFAFAIPSQRFSMAVTLNKLNAMSIAAAVVIAVTCRAFEVGTPESYFRFAERACVSSKPGGFKGNPLDSDMIEQMINGRGDGDFMKMLIG